MKIDINPVSPAMLKLFTDCPAKFYYRYIEQIPFLYRDKNFAVGKNNHALAAYYLKKQDIRKLEKALSQKEIKYWKYLKNNKYFSYEIIGVEKSIYMHLGDFWLGGRIDSIVKNNNEIYILDYKTGGVPDDMTYEFQTMIYLLLSDKFYKNYKSLIFVYLDLKNKVEQKITFSNTLKTEFKKRLIKVCRDITNFEITKFSSPKGCICEYSSFCQ